MKPIWRDSLILRTSLVPVGARSRFLARPQLLTRI
jgi:hypothetical protein